MRWFLLNMVLTATLVAVVARLSRDFPRLGGFLISLPLSTMIVLLLSRAQHGEAAQVTTLARSILVAVPISLVFLVPFALPDRLRPPFWACYALGLAGLAAGYFVHKAVLARFAA